METMQLPSVFFFWFNFAWFGWLPGTLVFSYWSTMICPLELVATSAFSSANRLVSGLRPMAAYRQAGGDGKRSHEVMMNEGRDLQTERTRTETDRANEDRQTDPPTHREIGR